VENRSTANLNRFFQYIETPPCAPGKEDTMDHEEKILEILSQMQADMRSMNADMTSMKADMATMKDDMTAMKTEMTAVKDDMMSMKAEMAALKDDMTATKADITTLKNDMTATKADITTLKDDMTATKADITTLKDDMTSMKAEMATMRDRIDQIDERSRRTALLLEVDYKQKLDLLYEGHESIMEYLDKLAAKSRVEVLEGDVALLKDAVKHMRQEITELKKAQ